MSKISFCLLDCYPENNIRMCKDTAGGYGTGNNFGKTLLSKILNIFTQSQIHQPQIFPYLPNDEEYLDLFPHPQLLL